MSLLNKSQIMWILWHKSKYTVTEDFMHTVYHLSLLTTGKSSLTLCTPVQYSWTGAHYYTTYCICLQCNIWFSISICFININTIFKGDFFSFIPKQWENSWDVVYIWQSKLPSQGKTRFKAEDALKGRVTSLKIAFYCIQAVPLLAFQNCHRKWIKRYSTLTFEGYPN